MPPAQTPIVIAHRGASGYLPEHSFAAKALAVGMGADYLEQDVVASRDGVPLVFHDLYLDALTDVATKFPGRARADGRHYCVDFTLDEIRRLSLHERIEPASGVPAWPNRFPADAALFRVPTLDEELALVRGLEKSTGRPIGVYPEIKAPAWHAGHGIDLADALLAALDRHGYLRPGERLYLQCFDQATLERLRADARCEHLALVQLIGSANAGLAESLADLRPHADAIGPSLSLFGLHQEGGRLRARRDLVADAHALGLRVHPYTLRADDLPAACASVDALLTLLFGQLGADGIFTDFPDRARAYLGGASGSSGHR